MTPEEFNSTIQAAFANGDKLPHYPDIKQALGKNSLVQPINTYLSHNAAALIDD